MEFKYKIIRKIGTLGDASENAAKEVNIIQWGKYAPSLDIRKWYNGKPGKGITLSEDEAEALYQYLKEEHSA